MIAVEDQFVSEFFVCDVDKEGMVFFMKFGIKYIKQLKLNLKTHF